MAKFYTISPMGCPENPVLFPNLRPTFIEQGHSFVDNIEEADCVLFDLHSRVFDYNQDDIDYLCQSRIPIATFCEWDRGGLSSDEWPSPTIHNQRKVFKHIKNNGIKSVHFCRLLDKTKQYPENLYPYEKPYSYEEPLLSPDELFAREWDICYIANHSPSRQSIADAIVKDGRIKHIISLGNKKLPFDEFLKMHKKAKLFINSSAGGYTCERPQCLFSIAGMIRQNTQQLLLHDFTHGENCLRVDNPPTQKDLDEIFEIVNDKERLYSIYKRGVEFVKEYYSADYIANDILSKINKHTNA